METLKWNIGASLYNDERIYWIDDPNANLLRWHVGFQKAHTFGSVPGQILEKDGWYWYTIDYAGNRSSSMFGPFSSDDAAMADCEVAHRPENL